jgi:heat shock protein HslJ
MNDSDSRSLPPQPTSLCMRYQPLLALLRTDTLLPREASMLTEHISGCSWCQRELATYDALDAAARQHLSTVTFTPLTLEDIMQTTQPPMQTPAANAATTRTRGVMRRTGGPWPAGRPPISVLGPLAAVIALILLAGLIFTTHGLGPTPGSGTPIPTIPTATLPTVSQQTAALAQSTWMLRVLYVGGHHEQPIVALHAPTLRFQPHDDRGGNVIGNSGCNGYFGSYTLTDTMLHINTLGTTNMACSPYTINDQETAYLGALPHVEQFHLDGDSLTLASGDSNVQLDFHAIHSAALAQSTWKLTQLIVDGHEQPLAPSHAPTLHLQSQDDRSGKIQGTGGCNAYSGSYTLTDTMLRMSISASTQVGCQSIVSTPENAYLQALPRVERYYLQGDTLTLGSADGSVRLTFHASH